MSVWRNLHLLKGSDLNLGQNPICARDIFSALQLSISYSAPISESNRKLTRVEALRAGRCGIWISPMISLNNAPPTRDVWDGGEGRRTAVERGQSKVCSLGLELGTCPGAESPEVSVFLGFGGRTQQLPLTLPVWSWEFPSEYLQASKQQYSWLRADSAIREVRSPCLVSPPLQKRWILSSSQTFLLVPALLCGAGVWLGARKATRVVRGVERSISQPGKAPSRWLDPKLSSQGHWTRRAPGSCRLVEYACSPILFLLAPQVAGNAKFWLHGHLLLV